jgi:hypothetical protein
MTTYKIQIDDLLRDATEEEIAQIEANEKETARIAKLEASKLKAKQAVIEKLGLTADEVIALLS